jgi:hypothetical protein
MSFLSDWWPATSPSALSSGPKGSAESEALEPKKRCHDLPRRDSGRGIY